MFARRFSLPWDRSQAKVVAPQPIQTVSGPSRDAESAPLEDFANFLRTAGETNALSSHQLHLLYGEFVLDTDTVELTLGQLHRRLGAAGIERYREPVGQRRWFYRVRPLRIAAFNADRRVA